jgi:predicted ATP-dependent protease
MIPHQNVADLMLRHDVVSAVENKMFHVYAVKNVDQGIELLTGKSAGKALRSGKFEPGSVNARADARLTEYATRVKKFG